MNTDRPRRPSKVILLIALLWLAGGLLQSLIGSLLASSGAVDASTAGLLGQVLGWGLLIVVFYVYRTPLEAWLRR